MPGSIPDYILVHTATPVSYAEPQGVPATWIEGEPGDHGGGTPTPGAPFRCVLFLPGPGGEAQNAYRPRTVRQPTLLFNPTRDDLSAVVLSDEDEVMVDAPELAGWTGAETARWLCVGDSQPFGPPGRVIGVVATLRQVKD